ncbi:uncharacterized protein LOC143893753 [Temnothorax americanus]|uniref:uncharacterized protein LOC143893753 n=1 Tax=Temnothorax americanus TaxID=1964332 RepID=UPI004068BAA1
MANILNIGGEPIFDDSVVKIETHTYNPYSNTTFGHNDEIRIPIQQQDLYTLPCESFLYVKGRLVIKRNDESVTTLANNCVAFMFDEIRYELNGVKIDRNRNVGITSTIKNYVSLSYNDSQLMRNAVSCDSLLHCPYFVSRYGSDQSPLFRDARDINDFRDTVGRISKACRGNPRCIYCGGSKHDEGIDCPSKDSARKCIICGGAHLATSFNCERVINLRKAYSLAAAENMLFETKKKISLDVKGDVVIYSTLKDLDEAVRSINESIRRIVRFFLNKGLTLSPTKSQTVIFSRKRKMPLVIPRVVKKHATTFYTDGSKGNPGEPVSAGIYSPELKINIMHKLPPETTIFSAEAWAIFQSPTCILQFEYNKTVIFSNAKSILENICSYRPNQQNYIIPRIKKKKSVRY